MYPPYRELLMLLLHLPLLHCLCRQEILQENQELIIPYLVQRRIPNYPVPDNGPFQFVPNNDLIFPGYVAEDFAGRDLRVYVEVLNIIAR